MAGSTRVVSSPPPETSLLARSCNKAERERYFVFGESLPSRFSRFEIDVTGCRYAEFYKELGEPELGFLLVCGADFTTAKGFGPDIKLTHADHHARRQPL